MSRVTALLGAAIGAAGILAGASPLAAQTAFPRHRIRYAAQWMERGPRTGRIMAFRGYAGERLFAGRAWVGAWGVRPRARGPWLVRRGPYAPRWGVAALGRPRFIARGFRRAGGWGYARSWRRAPLRRFGRRGPPVAWRAWWE